MSIPLPVGLGNNRGIVPFNGAAKSLSLYDCLKENPAFLSMQFLFNSKAVWKVDLSANAPKRPLQKISCLYVDALNSTHDAIIYFPATGWGIRVGAGTQFLVNDLVGRGDYVFYVSLKGQITNPTDIINVFAINVNLPFFDTLWQYGQNVGLNGNVSTWFFSQPHVCTLFSIVDNAFAFISSGTGTGTFSGNAGPLISQRAGFVGTEIGTFSFDVIMGQSPTNIQTHGFNSAVTFPPGACLPGDIFSVNPFNVLTAPLVIEITQIICNDGF